MAQEEGGGKSQFSKRQKFVVIVFLLSAGIFVSEFFTGTSTLLASLVLATLTDILLYWVLRKDIRGTAFIPIFILPFFYTLSCGLFYSVVPQRMISRVLITLFYSFGLYSLLLTQNIFAVSTLRTINLVRSARIVSFVLTLVILFFLTNTNDCSCLKNRCPVCLVMQSIQMYWLSFSQKNFKGYLCSLQN